jgi:uncharacterized membrane protein
MHHVRYVADWLRARLWFIPAVMSAAALALAVLILRSPASLMGREPDVWWLFSGDAGTARDLLTALLSGMITMTSLVVSITVVVLSLAAGQLGPRLIWSFIGDRQIQAVIGLFLGTILYTLVVLRSINDELGVGHVPHLAITIASAMTVACLFALLFHVSKLARSIVSDTMIDEVAHRLDLAISRMSAGEGKLEGAAADPPLPAHRRAVAPTRSGYVQYVDYARLCRMAARHDVVLKVDIRPGQYALEGSDYLRIHAPGPVDDELVAKLRSAIALGPDRTPTQDLEFLMRQLVEVALRALSPSLNDPYTAVAVINRLAAALAQLQGRVDRQTLLRDEKGTLRVVSAQSDFAAFVDAAFDPIRQSAGDNVLVLLELARRIVELLNVTPPADREPLLRHLRILQRLAPAFAEPDDRRSLEAVVLPAIARFG